ncbi:MAG TPA: hypothetical protein VIH57_00505 [Bacteroidales bacterium]
MSKIRLSLFCLLLLPLPMMGASEISTALHGETGRRIVTAALKDSIIFVEYNHSNISGIWTTSFDTLKLSHQKYIGNFSKIEIKNNNFQFQPGSITLISGKPDSSFNNSRNLGYSNYMDKRLNKVLEWTGADLAEFKSRKWNGQPLVSSDPEHFKKLENLAFDSLCSFYTSGIYTQTFWKVVIKDYRIFPKKYVESTDNAEIYKIWKFLSQASATERNIFPYLIQLPIPVAFVSIIDFDIALLALPFTYPALIGGEIFISNRILSKSTYKIIFYKTGKKGKLTIKIRKSKILCTNYVYHLNADFRKLFGSL